MKLLVLTLLVTGCIANPVYKTSGIQADGSYSYSYDNGQQRGRQFRDETRQADGTVVGKYGYEDPTGALQVVHYTAGKDGYVVTGRNVDSGQVQVPKVVQSAPGQPVVWSPVPSYSPQNVQQQVARSDDEEVVKPDLKSETTVVPAPVVPVQDEQKHDQPQYSDEKDDTFPTVVSGQRRLEVKPVVQSQVVKKQVVQSSYVPQVKVVPQPQVVSHVKNVYVPWNQWNRGVWNRYLVPVSVPVSSVVPQVVPVSSVPVSSVPVSSVPVSSVPVSSVYGGQSVPVSVPVSSVYDGQSVPVSSVPVSSVPVSSVYDSQSVPVSSVPVSSVYGGRSVPVSVPVSSVPVSSVPVSSVPVSSVPVVSQHSVKEVVSVQNQQPVDVVKPVVPVEQPVSVSQHVVKDVKSYSPIFYYGPSGVPMWYAPIPDVPVQDSINVENVPENIEQPVQPMVPVQYSYSDIQPQPISGQIYPIPQQEPGVVQPVSYSISGIPYVKEEIGKPIPIPPLQYGQEVPVGPVGVIKPDDEKPVVVPVHYVPKSLKEEKDSVDVDDVSKDKKVVKVVPGSAKVNVKFVYYPYSYPWGVPSSHVGGIYPLGYQPINYYKPDWNVKPEWNVEPQKQVIGDQWGGIWGIPSYYNPYIYSDDSVIKQSHSTLTGLKQVAKPLVSNNQWHHWVYGQYPPGTGPKYTPNSYVHHYIKPIVIPESLHYQGSIIPQNQPIDTVQRVVVGQYAQPQILSPEPVPHSVKGVV